MQMVLGVLAGLFSMIGGAKYIWATLRHKAKPERAAWWIWFMLNIITFSAQWAAGASWSQGLIVGLVLVTGLLAFLSLKFGYGTFSRRDYISISLALLGLVLWRFTKDPLAAIVLVVIVDMLGAWLIILKAWRAPDSEVALNWALSSSGALLAAFAVGEVDLVKLLFPLYVTVADGTILAVVLYRRRVVRASSGTIRS